MRQFWSTEELTILKRVYTSSTAVELCRLLPNRTACAITMAARKLRLGTKVRSYKPRRSLKPMPDSVAILAYAAALVDGEGTIGVYLHTNPDGRTYPHARASIANTNRAVMDWMLANFGGRVYNEKQRHDDGYTRKPIFKWACHGRQDTHDFLSAILPYMIIKRSLADKTVESLRILLHRVIA